MCCVWLSVMTILLSFCEAFGPSEAYFPSNVAQAIPNLELVATENIPRRNIFSFLGKRANLGSQVHSV